MLVKKLIKELEKQTCFKPDAGLFADPPNVKIGDIALPCFSFAKKQKKSPAEIAKEIAKKMQGADFLESVKADGPYVNFVFKQNFLFQEILNVETRRRRVSKRGPEKIMIEYSQPNTHKEFHVGHLRNVCLGSALINILRAQGHKVIATNYIGDIGTHVAKTLWAYEKFYKNNVLPENKGKFLGEIYVMATKKVEDDPDLKEEVSKVLQNLEIGEKEIIKLWEKTRKWSLDQFKKIYQELNAEFDVVFYESEEELEGKKIVQHLLKQGWVHEVKESDGAIIADLEQHGLKVLVLIKSDGTATYGAKDLALGIKKANKYHPDKSLYIVDNRQSLYLKQIFKLLELLGHKEDKTHISYDFVTTSKGAMAARTGNVIPYEYFAKKVTAQLVKETKKRHKDWSAKKVQDTARKIMLAAVKFGMLRYERKSVIVFDIEKELSFEGATGPYLLYANARINSLFAKARAKKLKPSLKDVSRLDKPIERELVLKISKFDKIVQNVARTYEPLALCNYLLELAQLFNNFYHKCPVLTAKKDVAEARLALAEAVQKQLTKGLELLNIEVLEGM